MRRTTVLSLVMAAAGLGMQAGVAAAQAPDPPAQTGARADTGTRVSRELRGRHAISVSLGMLTRVDVDLVDVRTHGMLGGLSYAYWPASTWNVEISAALHDSRTELVNTVTVTSLLFGTEWYPRQLALAPDVRAYLGAAVGPYTATRTDPLGTHLRTVLGARLGGGVDAFPAGWLRAGLRGAYHFAPEFDDPGYGVRSASGPQLSVELGVMFGGRH